MKKAMKLCLLLVIFGMFTPVNNPANWVKAQDNTPAESTACFALDVMFVIDQSDSMSGSAGAPANDPLANRAFAPRWAIDYLADNALDICPDAIHRVGMVSFGSEVSVDLELTEVDPDSVEQATRIRSRLKDQVVANAMGQTDPKLAFERAAEMLTDAGPIEGGGKRKRVVIFMTDGEPCVENLGCLAGRPNTMDFLAYGEDLREFAREAFPFDPTLLKQEQCLKAARDKYEGEEIPPEVISECLYDYLVPDNDYEDSVYIYTMLLRKGTAYSRLLHEIYAAMSEEHGGELIDLKENTKDIVTNFLEILTRLAGVKASRITCGSVAVNPFLRVARMIFFKIDKEIPVRIYFTDEQGKIHQIENGEHDGAFNVASHYSEGANERYEFNMPYPGIWTIESDVCEGIDAYYEAIDFEISDRALLSFQTPQGEIINPQATESGEVRIPKYGQEPYYDLQNPYYLLYELRDKYGNLIPEMGLDVFHINWNIQITAPDGQVSTYTMEWQSEQQNFRSSEPLRLPLQGEYTIKVSADVVQREPPYRLDGRNLKEVDVFSSSRHLFDDDEEFKVVCPNLDYIAICPWQAEVYTATDGCQVCPIHNFNLELVEPVQGEPIGPVHGTLRDGWPLPVQPFQLSFRISDMNGKPLALNEVFSDTVKPVRLTVSAAGVPEQEVIYMQDPISPTLYSGEVIGMPVEGGYKARLELTSPYSEFWRPTRLNDERDFFREDGPWNRESTYRTLLYIALALLAALLIYNILIRTNPVRGALVFTHYDGEMIASLPLRSDKNWKIIGSRTLNAYPQLDLKRIRAVKVGKAGRRRAAETDVLDTLGSGPVDPEASVRVEFLTRSGTRFSETLQSGTSVPFAAHGEENLFQMEYRKEGF